MILQSVLVVTRVGSCRALCHATKQTLTIQPNVPSLLVLSALNKTITAASLMTSTAPIITCSRDRALAPRRPVSRFSNPRRIRLSPAHMAAADAASVHLRCRSSPGVDDGGGGGGVSGAATANIREHPGDARATLAKTTGGARTRRWSAARLTSRSAVAGPCQLAFPARATGTAASRRGPATSRRPVQAPWPRWDPPVSRRVPL